LLVSEPLQEHQLLEQVEVHVAGILTTKEKSTFFHGVENWSELCLDQGWPVGLICAVARLPTGHCGGVNNTSEHLDLGSVTIGFSEEVGHPLIGDVFLDSKGLRNAKTIGINEVRKVGEVKT